MELDAPNYVSPCVGLPFTVCFFPIVDSQCGDSLDVGQLLFSKTLKLLFRDSVLP